jgi:hypothetical protein
MEMVVVNSVVAKRWMPIAVFVVPDISVPS